MLSELPHNIVFPETGDQPCAFRALKSLVSQGPVYIRGDDGREELYDLMNDPRESADLVTNPQAGPVIDRFREELRLIDQGAPPPAR